MFIDLKTTLLGCRLVAQTPDVRYCHGHTVFPAPEVERFGRAHRTPPPHPIFHDEMGRPVSSVIRLGTWGPVEGRHGPIRLATGERYAAGPGEPGLCSELLPGVILASDDPDVEALYEEVRGLDRAWAWANAAAIAHEDRTQELVAAAAASEGIRGIPTGLECLECGATYSSPGHVESGGMGCDRCNG